MSTLTCLCGLMCVFMLQSVFVDSVDDVTISPELARFIGTLEKYTNTQNEVVFLLDESGSIEERRYPEVLLFTKLTVRRFAVSAERSRVAIISFSDYTRTHANYIKDSAGNNMCTLIGTIDGMDYVGLGTATRLAMEKSQELFAQARQNSNKIIVLMTDGQSNWGYSPVDIAARMKRDGVIIFAVGVAQVNVKEIEDVATSKDHIYILKNFDYIQKVNEYLVKEINEISWDHVKDATMCSKFCKNGPDCCDDHAGCYCGTIGGNYECNCGPGYFGTGHIKQCHECPKGTYKSTPGNPANCTNCPAHSTTLTKRSTSSNDCKCDHGYEWHGNYCKAIECAKLQAPVGASFIPTQCDNIFGTECKVKCKEGFCPYSCNFPNDDFQILPWNQLPLQSRTCLDTGKWSGNDFLCEKMRCPALEHPFDGKHNCSSGDFSFGTMCTFECNVGYERIGSNTRECLMNGSWSGSKASCLVNYCEPLHQNQYLLVKPEKCGVANMRYGSICRYSCLQGYTLTSQFGKNDGIKECLANKIWSGADNKISCEDTTPPSIQCPKHIVVHTDSSKSTASLVWNTPNATDNIFTPFIHIKRPNFIRKPPYSFPIGSTKIVYEAVDSVNLTNTCSFNVTVLDKEPPLVLFCPSDLEIFSEKNDPLTVTWDEPKFEDNSGKYDLTPPNKKSGDVFAWGSRDVIYYNVTDHSGNKASCAFTVTVKPYPCPYFENPDNSIVTCDAWQLGRLCSVYCKEGYEFSSKRKVPTVFECKQSGSSATKTGTWVPFVLLPEFADFSMPIPDCSKIQKRNVQNFSMHLNYTVDECTDDVIHKMKKMFLTTLKDFDNMIPGMICPTAPGAKSCSPENVNVACATSKSKTKRSIRLPRNAKNTLMVTFNFELHPSIDEVPKEEKEVTDDTASVLVKEIESLTSENVREVYNITSIPEPQVNYNIVAICSSGQIRVNNSCLNCPAGTFKEDFSGTCVDCPASTYQDKEKRLSCLPCPEGFATYQTRSKSFSDCKAPCQPGTFSRTSFEPCYPCPLHTYQNTARRQDCIKCPRGLQTWKVGSNSSSDCANPCNPGYYSDTGFQPCTVCDFGFYQDENQQKFCQICPNQTTTREKGSTKLDSCEEINICEELSPCANGSTCVPFENSYTCICQHGFFGKQCEETSNYCESDFCLNNGTCLKKSHEYHCECPEGFSGIRCEINIDDCKEGLCYNNGECIDLVNGYECVCSGGYAGKSCEINIFDCASDPCFNGGTCFDKLNGYKCCCFPGYSGHNCEIQVSPANPCESIKCQNNGVCTSNSTGTECSCATGFIGQYCETNIDDCSNHTCYNNGECIDGIGSATCRCQQMFSGPQCEISLLSEYSLKFTSPTTSDYAKIENSKRLHAITVSLFIRTTYAGAGSRPTALSYSYYDQQRDVIVDNALTLFDTNKLIIYLHGEMLHTGFSVNKDSNWHHYAIVWESKDSKWSFYVDGEVIVNGVLAVRKEYMWSGVFVLGQEQDSFGGTFSSSEAFVGDITEFNVWDYALSKDEIMKLSTKCGYIGNLISWFQVSNNVHGNVIVSKQVDLCDDAGLCNDVDDFCHCLYTAAPTAGYCKHFVPNCESSPCQNNQRCVEQISSASCNCSIEYDGRFCEYDRNECLDNNGGCSHSCVNTVGSYNCTCPEDMILTEDAFNCKDSRFCEVDGQILLDGQTWMTSCKECSCEKSIVTCQDLQCEDVKCEPEENLIMLPGECCPKCILYSFCFISPNNTMTTFEYSRYEFSDGCTYTVVEDCVHGLFSIRLDSSKSNNSLERNLILYQACSSLQLTPRGEVFINSETALPPFKNEVFDVKIDNSTIDIWTHSGLYVQWHLNGEILVAVPSEVAEHTCGVCGRLQEYNVINNELDNHLIGSKPEMKKCLVKEEEKQAFGSQASSFTNGYSCIILSIMVYFFSLVCIRLH